MSSLMALAALLLRSPLSSRSSTRNSYHRASPPSASSIPCYTPCRPILMTSHAEITQGAVRMALLRLLDAFGVSVPDLRFSLRRLRLFWLLVSLAGCGEDSRERFGVLGVLGVDVPLVFLPFNSSSVEGDMSRAARREFSWLVQRKESERH